MQQSFFGFFIDAGASKGLISITAVATIIQQYIQSASSLA